MEGAAHFWRLLFGSREEFISLAAIYIYLPNNLLAYSIKPKMAVLDCRNS
jgi:hypothetical protein